MTEFEQKLFMAVAKTIKDDNANLQALKDKVMAEVRAYCDKHKKAYKALNDFQKERLNDAGFVISHVTRFKYTEQQLDRAIDSNLKRVPGNLADEDKRKDLYNVLANLNFKCIYSDTLLVGGGQSIHLDHIIPVNLGGPTDDWNILPICGSCNSSKSDSHLLDWWEKEHTPQDEHKLVYIFEYMANRLLKSLNTKGVKVVTTLTDEQIRTAIELENKERQQEESKQQTIDLEEDDIEDDYEDVEEGKDDKIKRLDAITFLYQMLNHIKQNKQYIISQENLNQGILDTPSEKDKQRLIDKKFKKLEKLFNSIYKQNKRLTGAKTDIQLLDEQRKMVEYIKSLDIVSYYHISYTYFDELQQMLDQGKTDKEIQEFCNSVDRSFNVDIFIQELQDFMATHDGRYPSTHSEYEEERRLAGQVQGLRQTYRKMQKCEKIDRILTGEMIRKLNTFDFVWRDRENKFPYSFKDFCARLLVYKEEKKTLLISRSYVCEDGYPLGEKVHNLRNGTIRTNEEEKRILKDIGFVWEVDYFDIFLTHLLEYREEKGDCLVPQDYICEDGYQLGKTVNNIRTGTFNINAEQKKILNSPQINFVWDATNYFDFDKFYSHLLEYVKSNNTSQVPQKYVCEDGYSLGSAVSRIRLKLLKLEPEQYSLIDSEPINFVWKTDKSDDFDFDLFITKLRQYVKDKGNAMVTDRYKCEDGYKLGQKVQYIRSRKELLDEKLIGVLDGDDIKFI
ncbi:MAG: HNH endonuclease, partial [Clostridia bacterium]|nr:HNH endonuclease [Clostridia bacterium]